MCEVNDYSRASAQCSSSNNLVVVSYNMHGFNQGLSSVNYLIETITPDIISLQEHWLTSANLDRLNCISDSYFYYGSSAMDIDKGPLFGRPFGGTAIIVKKQLAPFVQLVYTAERYTVVRVHTWLIFSLYLPCTSSIDRDLIYEDIFREIGGIRKQFDDCKCLITGDLNTGLDKICPTSNIVNKFICEFNLYRCDVLIPVSQKFTYVSESLNQSSTIDYILTSDADDIKAFNVLDIDLNLSDHLPLLCICALPNNNNSRMPSDLSVAGEPLGDVLHLRWDHANLGLYYIMTGNMLQQVYDECELLHNFDNMVSVLPKDVLCTMIDELYENIISVLLHCSSTCVPVRKKNFYKFWWDESLNILKEKSITSCKLWKELGKPRSGPIFEQYQSDKMRYKKYIRDAKQTELETYSNDLHDALLSKNSKDFWRCWKSKFGSKENQALQVDGCCSNNEIAQKFAEHFSSVCSPSTTEQTQILRQEYVQKRSSYLGSTVNNFDIIDVETVERVISELKRGRACGLDNLMSEHLQYSHPVLVVLFTKIFRLFMKLGHIPHWFGKSYTVPIPKGNKNYTAVTTVNDYRGISISPIISKVFEHCILISYSDIFRTSPNQFGFKKGRSCSDAIYCVQTVVNHYVSNGSTVNLCAIDLSKAFDKMSHFALLLKLMKKRVPCELLVILEMWFSISTTCVKWVDSFSVFFELRAGVRQGGVLSPQLFAVYIDDLVSKVNSLNVGCYLSFRCFSIILYADDILLLSPSVSSLQTILSECEKELSYLDMQINISKSVCLRIGARCNNCCANILTKDGVNLVWTDLCRYLGIYLEKGCKFKCSFREARVKFYRSFNAVFGRIGRSASLETILELVKTKCIPILIYNAEVCGLNHSEKHALDFAVTRILMKLFKTSNPTVVRDCQFYFKFLSPSVCIDIRRAKFLCRIQERSDLCHSIVNQARIDYASLCNSYGWRDSPNINKLVHLIKSGSVA